MKFKTYENGISKPYVCISEYASDSCKMLRNTEAWMEVVNYLKSQWYEVVVISKEKTKLTGVIDKSAYGYKIEDRINDLQQCEFFIGCSSGLSWLASGLNKHVFLISDYTPPDHEFKTNCTGIWNKASQRIEIKHMVKNTEEVTVDEVISIIDNAIKKSKT